MSLNVSPSGPFDLIKPYVWLAVFAFSLGFSICLFAGTGSVVRSHSSPPSTFLASATN